MLTDLNELSRQTAEAERYGTQEYMLEFCRTCKKKKQNFEKGIVCGLTNEKPDFFDVCEMYEIDAEKKIIEEKKKEKEKAGGFIGGYIGALFLGFLGLFRGIFLSEKFDFISISIIVISIMWLIIAGIRAHKASQKIE